MKKILSLITALALIAMATPTFSAVGNGSEPETVPPEQEIAAPADSPEESEEVIPASLGEAESGIQPYAQTSKVEYSDSNIIGGSIYYDPASGTIVDCDTNVISCVIPSEIDGVKITTIGTRAFDNVDLVSVTIPEGIITINEYAFSHTDLKSVTIPESVTALGNSTFYNCDSLKAVNILGTCTIGSSAFSYSSIEQIRMPKVISIGSSCFMWSRNLYDIELPEGIDNIPSEAFLGCEALSSIKIPSTVKTIGNKAFAQANLTGGIELPVGLKSIGSEAFRESSLSGSVVIPDGCTEIGENAFRECSISAVTIPGTIKNIPNFAFYETISLISIKMGEGVESIGNSAFYVSAANSITGYLNRQVYIPSTLQFVLENAFGNFFTDDETIGDVYYNACENKWNTIIFGAKNHLLTNAPRHYYNGSGIDHDYQYTYDDSNHWLACKDCGLVSGERSPHVMDGGKCTVCKYGAPEEHVHSFTYGTDVHVHWQICKDCGFTCNVEEHVFSGNVCTKCNYVKTESGLSGDMDNNGEITLDDAIEILKRAMNVNS